MAAAGLKAGTSNGGTQSALLILRRLGLAVLPQPWRAGRCPHEPLRPGRCEVVLHWEGHYPLVPCGATRQ
ncbi:hypothetical protein GCM10010195_34210 [Kitasatospora griseola]|nr:hypothetical protein GCM10010195_34210 [Kitasatospora griseola]